MAPIDPHSFTDSEHPLTSHVSLSLYFDFDNKTIYGSARHTLQIPYTGDLYLDTRCLKIQGVHDTTLSNPQPFGLENSDPIKGTLLRISLTNQNSFIVTFKTHPSASALQWLNPSQTAGKRLPYVYTQCQSIHARSIFPCQDTPRARICYSALLNVPQEMSSVMSAAHLGRAPPAIGEAKGACEDDKWVMHDRVVEHFLMQQPIPPYLFAFAVGNIVFKEVGPRTRIYSEPSPILEAAELEFKNSEETIKQGEKLFGDYEWERFDLLVLPPSFPYGGMENPRVVFLTPTVIVGDTSGGQVVAHELAHSWTGNLVTNASNNDFWLNEGFTTYAERRIVEVVDGEERAALNIGLGCSGLRDDMERFKDNIEFTKLRTNQEGIDPDDIYSCVPYEKGFQFLWRIERQAFQLNIRPSTNHKCCHAFSAVLINSFGGSPRLAKYHIWVFPIKCGHGRVGRPAFDAFVKKYIHKFKFQSIDTDTFLDFLKKNLPGIESEIDLDVWIDGAGIPPDAMEPVSTIHNRVLSASRGFCAGRMPSEEDINQWEGQEWHLYLESLPKKLDPSQISALDGRFRFSESSNWEVKVAFLTIVAYSGYQALFGEIEKCLKDVGRMMFLRLLYTGLLQSNSGEEGKKFARRVFEEAKDSYHPIAQAVVESLLSKYS